jgi:hypothetical protein
MNQNNFIEDHHHHQKKDLFPNVNKMNIKKISENILMYREKDIKKLVDKRYKKNKKKINVFRILKKGGNNNNKT